jgi:isocitrate dehydrogenase kinase/phosphatase
VAKNDVFPETFGPFLLGNPRVRAVFMQHHADLLEPTFWQQHKARIAAGHVHDVFPYERERRLHLEAPAPA